MAQWKAKEFIWVRSENNFYECHIKYGKQAKAIDTGKTKSAM